jgi:hypothetical protein
VEDIPKYIVGRVELLVCLLLMVLFLFGLVRGNNSLCSDDENSVIEK